MTKVPMKTQGVLLLVCLLAPVLGQVHNEESVIDLQDLLINVQSTLKAFKQDQDEIRKSADARLDKFEKAFKKEKKEIWNGVDARFDKFEKSVDTRLDKFEKSVDTRLDKFEKSVDTRLDKFEKSAQTFKEEVSGRLDKFGKQDLEEFKTGLADRLADRRENFSALLLSRLNNFELQISKLCETTVQPTTLQPTSQNPTTPQTTREPIVTVRDCADVYDQQSQLSGVFTIQPRGSKSFQVYCDMTTDGGGWTVFQKRGPFPGVKENDFYRGWQEYKDGFGDLKAEFWIGLSKISSMTRPVNGDQELRIDMADFNGERWYAEYKKFEVQDETQQFRLSIGTYSGNASDALSYSNLQKFTTHDSDNDEHPSFNCAVHFQGAWWYKACSYCTLNGLNTRNPQKIKASQGIGWIHMTGVYKSLAQTEMKFRRMGWTQKNS